VWSKEYRTLNPAGASENIELASLIDSDVHTQLRGDPGRVRQVLTNLLGNAVKFTERGDVFIRATKESETFTHIVVRFAISDKGIGISDAGQHRLFKLSLRRMVQRRASMAARGWDWRSLSSWWK
jgi:signal transduction histidine kinase